MTITLVPENETLLRNRAAQDHQDADTLANAMLTEALTESRRSDEEKQKAFHEAMLAAGLITRIKPPRTAENTNRPIFEVQGEPLSATIIRERR